MTLLYQSIIEKHNPHAGFHGGAGGSTKRVGLPERMDSLPGSFPEYRLQSEDLLAELQRNRERIEHYVFLLALSSEGEAHRPHERTREIMEHIRDCAVSLAFAPDIGAVVDIGTGGGLPGIVWALCRPKLKITL